MRRHAIIFIFVNYCALLFSQKTLYSRVFPANPRSVPLEIINDHGSYFYLLRYNKLAHDLTIERRSKPSGEILSFTPLKLDSVNATWFNYENLEHAFFESNYKTYFVFEKSTVKRKEIFMKVIDTNGRSTGFIPVCSIDHQKGMTDFGFNFHITSSNKLLVVQSRNYVNNTTYKVAMLYDPVTLKTLWTKKPPPENLMTGSSMSFECTDKALSYLIVKSTVTDYETIGTSQTQSILPVYHYDSLYLVSLGDDNTFRKKNLAASDFYNLNNALIVMDDSLISVSVHFGMKSEKNDQHVFFLHQGFTTEFLDELYSRVTPLDSGNIQKLTFYDGTGNNSPAAKSYSPLRSGITSNKLFIISERKENDYYKELLFILTDRKTGLVEVQLVIPRKILYFDDRQRFRNLAVPVIVWCDSTISVFVLENKRNLSIPSAGFQFQKFIKLRNLKDAVMVRYFFKDILRKQPVFTNANFDIIPLKYSSNRCDVIFYLNQGRTEKFAFLDPASFL